MKLDERAEAFIAIIFVVFVFACLLSAYPIKRQTNVENRGKVCIPAKTIDGQQIEIRVFAEPREDGGYVINVKRPSDPPGECWGTTIYPMGDK